MEWPDLDSIQFSTIDNSYDLCSTMATNARVCENSDDCSSTSIIKSNGGPICCTGGDACLASNLTVTNLFTSNNNDSQVASFYNNRNNKYQIGIRRDGAFSLDNTNAQNEVVGGGHIYFTSSAYTETSTASTSFDYDVICSGAASCIHKPINTARNVYCPSDRSCWYGEVSNIGNNVYGLAYQAFYARSTNLYNIGNNVYCGPYQSCYYANVKNITNSVFGVGYQTLRGAIIEGVGNAVIGIGTECFDGATISNVPKVVSIDCFYIKFNLIFAFFC